MSNVQEKLKSNSNSQKKIKINPNNRYVFSCKNCKSQCKKTIRIECGLCKCFFCPNCANKETSQAEPKRKMTMDYICKKCFMSQSMSRSKQGESIKLEGRTRTATRNQVSFNSYFPEIELIERSSRSKNKNIDKKVTTSEVVEKSKDKKVEITEVKEIKKPVNSKLINYYYSIY